jgi:hypothetical protein
VTTLTEYAGSALDISYANGVSSQFAGGPTVNSGASASWTNVTDIEGASDSVYATVTIGSGSPDYSNVLLGYNYSFSSIASGSTVSDVSCAITGDCSNSSSSKYMNDLVAAFYLYNSANFSIGQMQGSNLRKASSFKWPNTATAESYDGGSGISLPTIQNSNFGFVWAGDGYQTASSVTASMDDFAISVTYTGGSAPSAPTGLSATCAPSPVLTWTNPSGTLTDTKVQYSTNDSSWTTIDVGSSVSTYTLTGLTANTLYYFQVAAVNSGGTSSYSTYAYAYTAAVQTLTTTLSPISDYQVGPGWSNTGGASSCSAALADGSDSTYATAGPSPFYELDLTLSTPPSNLIAVTGVTVNIRAKTANGSYTTLVGVNFVRASGTTNLFGAIAPITASLTTSFANYNASSSSPLGTQALADWTGAIIALLPSDYQGDNEIAEASVTITYWAAAADVPTPLFPPGALGIGPQPAGLTPTCRRGRVEGVRFRHT